MANSGEPVPRCKFTNQEKKDFRRALNTYPDTYDRYAKIASDERLSFLNKSANPQFKIRTNVDLKDLKRNMISPHALLLTTDGKLYYSKYAPEECQGLALNPIKMSECFDGRAERIRLNY